MGDENLTPAPCTFCCPIQSGAQRDTATVPWRNCQGDAYGDFWLKQTAFRIRLWAPLLVVSSGHHLTPKGLNVLSWRSSLGWYPCHHAVFIQGGARSREPVGPMVSPFLETLGSAGVRSAKHDESVRLLPTLGFFITRTPRCSWFWEGLCPHTK